MAKIKKQDVEAATAEALVYVGPNLTRGGEMPLLTYQVYRELPAQAQNDPDLKELFVPFAQMPAARRELQVKGSRLHNLAQKAAGAKS